MKKTDLRKKYSTLRQSLTQNEVDNLSIEIANRTLQLPIWDKAYYHIFLSISEKKEINTEFLLHILQGKDISICIPKANFKTYEMQHVLLQENTPIKISAYGIPEPVDGIAISPRQLDVVFVPLLAFDTQGNRVWYGKGFYDRFLAQCKPECLKIGLSFFESEPTVLADSSDFPLNYCVTPKKTYRF